MTVVRFIDAESDFLRLARLLEGSQNNSTLRGLPSSGIQNPRETTTESP